MNKRRWSIERRLTVSLFILLFLYCLFFITKYQISIITGDSMNPTYNNHNIVILDRLAIPRKGDVVELYFGNDLNPSIKRVAYDHSDKYVYYVTDYFIDVGYITTFIDKEDGDRFPKSMRAEKLFLGVDEYIVLGDNPGVSYDSRQYGVINRNQIVGVVIQNQ